MRDLPDFEAEGLLEDLGGESREARLGLLASLYEDGVPLPALKAAVAGKRLALLPVEREIAGSGTRHTAREVAELSGLDVADVRRLIASLGFPMPEPDAPALTDDDLQSAIRLRRFMEAGLPIEDLLAVTRQVGSSVARIAHAHRDIAARNLLGMSLSEEDLADRLRESAHELMPLAEQAVLYALRSHLRDQIRRAVIAANANGGFGAGILTEVTVCFADLVGFTRLGESVDVERLGQVAERLEQIAVDVTGTEVRLVELMGDGAMLVAEDSAAMLDAALRFVEEGVEAGDAMPAVRIGLARGDAISQLGDWFGRPVNLASRITDIARPDSVLSDFATIAAAGESFHYSFAGERKFKGLDRPLKLYRVRREAKGGRGQPGK